MSNYSYNYNQPFGYESNQQGKPNEQQLIMENQQLIEQFQSNKSSRQYPIKIKLLNSSVVIPVGFDILLKNNMNQIVYSNNFTEATNLIYKDLSSRNSNIKRQLQALGLTGNVRVSSTNAGYKRGNVFYFDRPQTSELMTPSGLKYYGCWEIFLTTNKSTLFTSARGLRQRYFGGIIKTKKNKVKRNSSIKKNRKNKKTTRKTRKA